MDATRHFARNRDPHQHGRGQLIHTEALIDGLKEKKIGAGLDVYEEEAVLYEDTSDRIMDDDVLARSAVVQRDRSPR